MVNESLLPPDVRRRLRLLTFGNVVLLGVLAFGGYKIHRVRTGRTLQAASAVSASPGAVVNGQNVSMSEFRKVLRWNSGAASVQQLVDVTLIEQEASRQHVTLDDVESTHLVETRMAELQARDRLVAPDDPSYISQTAVNFSSQGVWLARQVRASLLLRKLALKGIGEDRVKKVYDSFKPVLSRYEVHLISVATPGEVLQVQEALKTKEFDTEASAVSLDFASRQTGGNLGYLTLPDIEDRLGPAAADTVLKMAEYGVSNPIATTEGMSIIKLGRILSEYNDLKPFAEDVLAAGEENAILYRIRSSARLAFPYFPSDKNRTGQSTHPGTNIYAPLPAAGTQGPKIFTQPAGQASPGTSSVFGPAHESTTDQPNVFKGPEDDTGATPGSNVFANPTAPANEEPGGVFAPPSGK